jgi:hypothetical protein
MRRGTIFLILFVVAAAIIVGVSQFLRNQPPVEVAIAVDPLGESWIRGAVDRFNASEPVVNATQRVRVSVNVMSDMTIWQGESRWTTEDHPAGWIPASSVSQRYASDSGIPFEILTPSLARTPLMWGGYSSRVNVTTGNGTTPLDWRSVVALADEEAWANLPGGETSWGFVKLAFPRPDQSIGGMGVLFSGAASFSNSADLSSGAVQSQDFRNWFQPVIVSVPNFSTLGADMSAVARGPSTVDIAILPESLWLNNLDGLARYDSTDPIRFSYPEYQFIFDFPLAVWDDQRTTEIERATLESLSNWLLSAAEQSQAATLGLRPAESDPATSAELFTKAEAYGVTRTLNAGQPIQPPSRTQAQGLIQWFIQQLR